MKSSPRGEILGNHAAINEAKPCPNFINARIPSNALDRIICMLGCYTKILFKIAFKSKQARAAKQST
jgi:hypothetical protein